MSSVKHLGNKTEYQTQVINPSLLDPHPRLNTCNADTGFDVWHCYETTFFLEHPFGQHVEVGITKLVFPRTNKNIIESKSLKLYMFTHANTVYEDLCEYEERVKKDISTAIDGEVEVSFFSATDGVVTEDNIEGDIQCTLRSNCKVTGQPDFGDLFINVGYATMEPYELQPLLTRLAKENHFHEECVELIFGELEPHFHNLEVYAKYTRRGGIDIWPYRSKGLIMTRPNFLLPNVLTPKTFRG